MIHFTSPMLRSLALCLLVSLLPAKASSDTAVLERFNEANADFAAGRYQEATREFRSLLDDGHVSTAILFDLGNAEVRAGRVGEAVLQYERALALSPRNPDVLANLRHVRAAAELTPPERNGWEEVAATLTVDEWAWLASAALWAGCLLLGTHALRSASESGLGRQKFAALLAIAAVCIVATLLAATRLSDLQRAVALGVEPGLREAPFEAAKVSVELSPGELVRIERSHGDFVLARTAADEAGWIRASSVQQILPP